MDAAKATRLSNGSRTMRAALLMQNKSVSGAIPYQNLGPLPDQAVYQLGNQRVTVKVICDPNGVPLTPPKWLMIHQDGSNTMMTPTLYRAWLDQAIRLGAEQVIELPWCRRQVHIRMEAQDYRGELGTRLGAIAQTNLDQLPPLGIYEETL